MSKYVPLANHLASLNSTEWSGSFSAIEDILGFALPQSAHLYPAWWANQTTPGHSQNQGWRSAGWKTEGLDLANKRVTFRKEHRGGPRTVADQLDTSAEPSGMTITQAKQALARFYDVPAANIDITIRG